MECLHIVAVVLDFVSLLDNSNELSTCSASQDGQIPVLADVLGVMNNRFQCVVNFN